MKKRYLIICALVSLILLITSILFDYFEITSLKTTYYEITSEKLEPEFNNFKIAQITDFHNTKIKKLTNKLIEEIIEEKPNIIVITGDLIDSEDTKESQDLITKIKNIAPIYYVTGNHEAEIQNIYNEFEQKLKENGVNVLRNEVANIEHLDSKITIIGIDSPEFMASSSILNECEIIFKRKLEELTENLNTFTILLSHRPDFFEEYINRNIDLTLSGHTHGGQVRVPIIGALYAPNQGLFPELDKGIYEKNKKYMIISGGIGTTGLPLRTFNKPELVVVELKTK